MLTITACVFSNNNSFAGAVGSQGPVTVTDCSFSDNKGGAISASGPGSSITDCVFSANSGGAAALRFYSYLQGPATQVTVTGCTFSDNSGVVGGAICNTDDAVSELLTVSGCTFSGNQTTEANGGSGGAIYSRGLSITVVGCMFTNNKAINTSGGAIYSGGPITVVGCAFTDNSGDLSGAIYCVGWSDAVTSCIFFSNSASDGGGGIYYNGGGNIGGNGDTLTINSSTFIGDWVGSTVEGGGGAILNYGYGINPEGQLFYSYLTLNECTVIGNWVNGANGALAYGGGIFNESYGYYIGNYALFPLAPPILLIGTSVTGNLANNQPDNIDGPYTKVTSPSSSSQFVTELITPASLSANSAATITLEYTNTGGIAMPAPLLVLTATQNGSQGAFLTLDPLESVP